jgi:hypothetical protein
MKNSVTPSGIETATFWFVAQHLNHCATPVPTYPVAGLMNTSGDCSGRKRTECRQKEKKFLHRRCSIDTPANGFPRQERCWLPLETQHHSSTSAISKEDQTHGCHALGHVVWGMVQHLSAHGVQRVFQDQKVSELSCNMTTSLMNSSKALFVKARRSRRVPQQPCALRVTSGS